MAGYAFQSLQARRSLQTRWEQGQTEKALAEALSVPLSTVYTELRRGSSRDRLPDQRRKYNAASRFLNRNPNHFSVTRHKLAKGCKIMCRKGSKGFSD